MDLDQPGLGMAREYLMKGLDDPDVQAYQEYMQDVALLLGADKDTVINDIKDTIKFEIELAKISLPRSIPSPTDQKIAGVQNVSSGRREGTPASCTTR